MHCLKLCAILPAAWIVGHLDRARLENVKRVAMRSLLDNHAASFHRFVRQRVEQQGTLAGRELIEQRNRADDLLYKPAVNRGLKRPKNRGDMRRRHVRLP